QYEAILAFIKRYVDLRKERPKKKLKLVTDGGKAVRPRSDYHHYSVLEAVVNLLIHRDLGLRGGPTRINIYDNSIELVNARRTNGFVPPAGRAIRYGISHGLNPQIAAIFTRREYGVNAPRGGLPMVLRRSTQFAGRRPEIYTANDEFKLKIYGL